MILDDGGARFEQHARHPRHATYGADGIPKARLRVQRVYSTITKAQVYLGESTWSQVEDFSTRDIVFDGGAGHGWTVFPGHITVFQAWEMIAHVPADTPWPRRSWPGVPPATGVDATLKSDVYRQPEHALADAVARPISAPEEDVKEGTWIWSRSPGKTW